MNDTTEENLRTALLELAESRSIDADARLRAVDYHPRTRRRLRWPLAGLAGTLAAAGAATAAVLLSSAAPEAFAGWTSVPAAPTPSAVAAATVACNASHPAQRFTGTPVLAEARDKYIAAIYVTPSTGYYHVCMSDGSVADTSTAGGHGFETAAPRADQLGLPVWGASSAPGFLGTFADYRGKTPSWWSALASSNGAGKSLLPTPKGFLQHVADTPLEHFFIGLAGQDVQSVTLNFDQGVTVDATVQNGWYFAWWPGEALPDSIQVTTNSGATTSSPVPYTVGWASKCHIAYAQTGSCGVFAAGLSPSAIRRQKAWLTTHPHASTGHTTPGH